MHLIPKPSGGRWPRALLAAIVRVWEKTRKPIIQKWSFDNPHSYDWAARGRSAEAAAWCQSLFDEAATDAGLSFAAVFVHRTKAF